MSFAKLKKEIETEDKNLQANDSRFQTCLITHREGFILQKSAFCEVRKDDDGNVYLVMFGEHIKPRIFEAFEISGYANFDMNLDIEE